MRFSNILRYYLSPVTAVAAVASAIAAKFAFDGGSSHIEGYPNSFTDNIHTDGFAMGGEEFYADTWDELYGGEESEPPTLQIKNELQPKFIKLIDGTVISFEKGADIMSKVVALSLFNVLTKDGDLQLIEQLAYKAKKPNQMLTKQTLKLLIGSGLVQPDGTFDPETHCYLKQLLS